MALQIKNMQLEQTQTKKEINITSLTFDVVDDEKEDIGAISSFVTVMKNDGVVTITDENSDEKKEEKSENSPLFNSMVVLSTLLQNKGLNEQFNEGFYAAFGALKNKKKSIVTYIPRVSDPFFGITPYIRQAVSPNSWIIFFLTLLKLLITSCGDALVPPRQKQTTQIPSII